MEVFSKVSVGDIPTKCAPFLETRWPPRLLCIPDKPFNVMEDVEGILNAARRMPDAMEPGPMPENVFLVLREIFSILIFVEVASHLGIALESLIENTLYSGVVFLPIQTPRVKISGNGPPRGYVDECAVLVPAQHN